MTIGFTHDRAREFWLSWQGILMLHWIVSNIIAILAIRGLPFVVFAMVSSRLSPAAKVLSVATETALILILCSFVPGFSLQFWDVCYGFALFTVFSIGFHGLRRLVQAGHVGKISALLASAIAFQLIPALLVRGPGAATVHVIGWELMLAAFSYCVDATRSDEQPRLGDGLFFLLINPILVFAERGHRLDKAGIDRRALTYISLGVGGLIAQASLHIVRSDGLLDPSHSPFETSKIGMFTHWAVLCLAQFLTIYAGLAGLGNLQVGLMRCVGYHVPERFVWPLFAKSPGEFWQRWNTYVAHWFTRYVFVPIARTRTSWFKSTSLRYTAATLITFAAVGLAHEYALLLQYGRARGAPTSVFVVAALIVISWKYARGWLRAKLVRGASDHPHHSILSRSLEHIVFTPLLLVMTWLAIPALSGRGLPTPLERLLVRSGGNLSASAARFWDFSISKRASMEIDARNRIDPVALGGSKALPVKSNIANDQQ